MMRVLARRHTAAADGRFEAHVWPRAKSQAGREQEKVSLPAAQCNMSLER